MVHHIGGGILVAAGSVAVIGLVLGVAMKPDLDERTRAVAHDWSAVSTALNHRADALGHLDTALASSGARSIAASGEQARAAWANAKGSSTAHQITMANELESATARALALAATPAYATNDAVNRAAVDLHAAAPPSTAVDTLDRAIAHSNAVDDNAIRRLVASVVGHDDTPTFIPAT